jgi:NADH-quinone oxidoreductase subunit L
MTDIFWLIPFVPALSTLILAVFGQKLPKKYVSFQACFAVFGSFFIAAISFMGLLQTSHESYPLVKNLFSWINAGSFNVNLSLQFDPLSAVMALVVSGVGFIIHVYSVGYMADDEGYTRYFTYLNLFTFAMLILVMASNVVLMFVGWEGVGLCSYLLIGFWFEKHSAANAGKKAFIVNRSLSCCLSEPLENPPRFLSTSGFLTPWRARLLSAPLSTRRQWSRPESTWLSG